MKIFKFLLLCIFLLNCSSRIIDYDRDKIIHEKTKNYITLLDNNKIDLRYIYLNKDNIKSITVNKKTNQIEIKRVHKTTLLPLQKLLLERLNKRSIGLVIINGIVINNISQIKIEPNSIKSFTIIDENKISSIFCKPVNGNIILITTK